MRIREFQKPVGISHYRVRAWTDVQTGGKRTRVVIFASPVLSPLSPSLMVIVWCKTLKGKNAWGRFDRSQRSVQ